MSRRAVFEYGLSVNRDEYGNCKATIDGFPADMVAGYGEHPRAALQELLDALIEWGVSGADRWIGTPGAVELARAMNCVDFDHVNVQELVKQ